MRRVERDRVCRAERELVEAQLDAEPPLQDDARTPAPDGASLEATKSQTPIGRLVENVTDPAIFLLENPAIHGADLRVDGGWSLT